MLPRRAADTSSAPSSCAARIACSRSLSSGHSRALPSASTGSPRLAASALSTSNGPASLRGLPRSRSSRAGLRLFRGRGTVGSSRCAIATAMIVERSGQKKPNNNIPSALVSRVEYHMFMALLFSGICVSRHQGSSADSVIVSFRLHSLFPSRCRGDQYDQKVGPLC